MPTCRRHYPGGNAGGAKVVPPVSSRLRPSPSLCWVGYHITRFEACSAFTHVTACLLAESLKRPFPSKASTVSLPPLPLRLLPAGTTSCRVGFAPTEKSRLGTAHKGDGHHCAQHPAGRPGNGARPLFRIGSYAQSVEPNTLVSLFPRKKTSDAAVPIALVAGLVIFIVAPRRSKGRV